MEAEFCAAYTKKSNSLITWITRAHPPAQHHTRPQEKKEKEKEKLQQLDEARQSSCLQVSYLE